MRDDFLRGARAVLGAVADLAVAAAWDAPSVLADQTVGSLAGHVARGGVWVVDDYLDLDPPSTPTFASAATYFAAVATIDEAGRKAIRDRGAAIAAEGRDVIVAHLEEALVVLQRRLAEEPPDRLLPVVGGAMVLDAYLDTRLVEQVVHLDDLARSVPGLDPAVPADLVARVAHIGLDVAVAGHGPTTLVRHLFRDGLPDEPSVVPVL